MQRLPQGVESVSEQQTIPQPGLCRTFQTCMFGLLVHTQKTAYTLTGRGTGSKTLVLSEVY